MGEVFAIFESKGTLSLILLYRYVALDHEISLLLVSTADIISAVMCFIGLFL